MQAIDKEEFIDIENWSAEHPVEPPPLCQRFLLRIDKERVITNIPEQSLEDLLDHVGKSPEEWHLFQINRNDVRLEIMPGQIIDLRRPGIERFKTKRRFVVCIEGEIHLWTRQTITTEEIAQLGGWDPNQGVIEVDENQNERTLEPGEEIELKPGFSFGKKICWKRGDNAGAH